MRSLPSATRATVMSKSEPNARIWRRDMLSQAAGMEGVRSNDRSPGGADAEQALGDDAAVEPALGRKVALRAFGHASMG